MNIHVPPSSACCPSPVTVLPWGWPYDSELERLRRLERETRNEEEKRRIRELLRRRGVPEHVIQGHPVLPWCPTVVRPRPLGVQDVLDLIGR